MLGAIPVDEIGVNLALAAEGTGVGAVEEREERLRMRQPAPGKYTPYCLFSGAAFSIRRGLWREFSSWLILLLWTGTAYRIEDSFADSAHRPESICGVDRPTDSNRLAVLARQPLR